MIAYHQWDIFGGMFRECMSQQEHVIHTKSQSQERYDLKSKFQYIRADFHTISLNVNGLYIAINMIQTAMKTNCSSSLKKGTIVHVRNTLLLIYILYLSLCFSNYLSSVPHKFCWHGGIFFCRSSEEQMEFGYIAH